MHILISFNNVYQFPGFPLLGLLDPDSLEVSLIDLPPEIPRTGILGLAQSSRYIYVGLQYAFDGTKSYRIPPDIGLEFNEDGLLASLNPCSLLVFDRKHFTLVNQYYFKRVKDVHSFYLDSGEGFLYVVSTGTDEVIRLELAEQHVLNETVFWRPEPDGELSDNYHLNSICEWKGDILVSGFGKKQDPQDWNSAKNGFVYNISKNITIMEGLQQPHSLAIIDGALACCESRSKTLRFLAEIENTINVGGYSRGLCSVGNNIYVGTSARRVKSKSTGKVNKNVETDPMGCTIGKISSVNYELQSSNSMNYFANEVYELMAVDGVDGWPLSAPVDFHSRFHKAWEQQRQLAFSEILNYCKNEALLVIVDEGVLAIDESIFPDHQVLPFTEEKGKFAGAPENDEMAIAELQRIHNTYSGLGIVFMWPAFWYLDSYKKLNDYLFDNYTTVFLNERIIIFRNDQ